MLTIRAARVNLGTRTVLHGIDVTIPAGQVTGLIGPNGSGKTTLLRAAAGLLPLAAGEIQLGEKRLLDYSARERARRIAYLAQGQPVHWPLSVRRVVELGRLPHGDGWVRSDPAARSAVQQAMAMADIAHLQHRPLNTLSGGERARALLARMLAVGAPLLLADEPIASLDPGHQLQVMGILRRRAAVGDAVVAVLHDLALAARFCDRLILLEQGRVVASGAPSAVLTSEHLAAAFSIAALSGSHDGQSWVLPWATVSALPSSRPPSGF